MIDTDLEEARNWTQAVADRHGETAVYCPHGHRGIDFTSRLPYVVLLSTADAWERKNALITCEPRKKP